MTSIKKIIIYPIKSLDGISLPEVTITEGGTLMGDREIAIIDENGKYINGKRNPDVYTLRTEYMLSERLVSFRKEGETEVKIFHLENDRVEMQLWLSNYFSQKVKLLYNNSNGYPDDTEAYGPTIISTGSLEEVKRWFLSVPIEELEKRFRPNIILSTNIPFWEDRLTGNEMKDFSFYIGPVLFSGVNICQRCAVPAKNPLTGVVYNTFQKTFSEKRKETLPEWADIKQFNHYYRLSVNTKIPLSETGKKLAVGDKVQITSAVK